MKRKLFIILSTLVLIITLLFSFVFKDNKENNKEISKVEKILSKPEGIQAYTLNGEKTNKEFNDLINNYVLDKITCKNGTIATYNKATNEVSLSNIHMPDYCTMNFKYTIYGKLLDDNTTIKTRTDFSSVFTETNTGTLYKSTESIVGSTPKEVYYFAGNAQNNWVKFGGYFWRIIRTNHDGSIRLLYSGTSPDTTSGFIGTSKFNTTTNNPMYVGYMYGTSGSQANNRLNTNDSIIKTYIDSWYNNNLSSFSKYISTEAVYCNDRELAPGAKYDIGDTTFYYAARGRLNTNKAPTYNCTNKKDAFSGSNGEAKLTYPVGLMTADEIAYAGGKAYTEISNSYAWYFLNSTGGNITESTWWWLLSPSYWNGSTSYVWYIHSSEYPGRLSNGSVSATRGVRPVISIKGNLKWKSGDGSSSSPYEVETPVTFYKKLLKDNPTISTRSDFSTAFTTNTSNTLYKATENSTDVYYFAGQDTASTPVNNWVKFGKNSNNHDLYWRIIRTNSDGSIRLLYAGTSTNTIEGYIGKSTFNENQDSPKYVGYMYGDGDTTLKEARTNTNDSTIKTYIDNWYENNLTTYTNYLSNDAIYCNDRELANENEYSASSSFNFKPYNRLDTNKAPTYDCTNSKDAFSVNNTEAKLNYPIALMTADEIAYAGGVYRISASMWYYTNSNYNSITSSNYWWLISPHNWTDSSANVLSLYGSNYPGNLYDNNVSRSNGVRPVVSLKSCTLWSQGDGSSSNPYEIVENGGC